MKDPRALLRDRGLAPKKSFGQNFLLDHEVLGSIASACVPENELGRAVVVELGAGTGALTAELVTRARHVFAVERDRDLVPILNAEFAEAIAGGRLTVVEDDAKTVDLERLFGDAEASAPRVLCGNLPYQLTGPLLERAVGLAGTVDRAVFLIQREVAERLAAEPSSKEYGALTVFVQAAFDVARTRLVKPGSFHPPPEVTSAVVSLKSRRPPLATETATFRALVKAAFAARRKTLRNAWAAFAPRIAAAAERAGVSLDARGETLSVADFARVEAELERT